MKLTVLVDNHTYIDRYFIGEPAVCYLIEDRGHGHNDHTWGLDPLIRLYSEAKIERLEYVRPQYIKPMNLHACHCTELKSKIFLSNVIECKEVGVGMTLDFI